ncbi:MAG: S46 family peptidase [Bacteroidales bacterium]|nr:S46 family peptidase [Bacteroidales bacterium]
MKRIILTILLGAALASQARADGGMWLPSLISQRIKDMRSQGCRLSAEDIYSINQASLKDAVMLFGGGCTGEMISDEGLLITNHHCGYRYIQMHSSVEHDYLRDGFWAMNRSSELPNPGLSVMFLERMEDVTDKVLAGVTVSMTESQRDSVVKAASSSLAEAASREGKGFKAEVEPLYYGNIYYLFVYREYRDVRLVGAPASSIGKFGGDTDNWMWPRHTGDFSIFRIYADKDNNPAEYSEDNVPYVPKRSLRISRKGVSEGDFTFVYGFPGTTREYLHSAGVSYVAEMSDPVKIDLRTRRLSIMKKYMDQSQAVRIQYSSKSASVANSWKKWQGEVLGLEKNHVADSKKAFERDFASWAKGGRYDGVLERLETIYSKLNPLELARDIYLETANVIELTTFAYNAGVLAVKKDSAALVKLADAFYKDWVPAIDREVFSAMMTEYDRLMADEFKCPFYKEKMNEYGSAEKWGEAIFDGSVFADRAKLEAALAQGDGFKSDPAYLFATGFSSWYYKDIVPERKKLTLELDLAYRDYMKAQMDYRPKYPFFPDANLTLRVTYGKVAGYSPADGVTYKPVSTLKGVMEKDNPDIFDYNIPQVLRDVYASGDYARVPVCFLATNHTTGGNSGSPVMDAHGNLVGLNFDRVWEGTMSDLAYDPEICRNISLDIRYVLFILEKVAGADHLIAEMKFAD